MVDSISPRLPDSNDRQRAQAVVRQARASALHQWLIATLNPYCDPSGGVPLSALCEELLGNRDTAPWWTPREIRMAIEDLVAARRLVIEAHDADIWLHPLPAPPVRQPPKRPPPRPGNMRGVP